MSERGNLSYVIGAVAAIAMVLVAYAVRAAEGQFVGDLVLKDNDIQDGRTFELMQPFGYIDPVGVRWQAERGLVTDGASIPQALWSIVGGPYEGQYRRAAIIHDFYCDHKYRSWERTHRVFYDGMLTGGVTPIKAKLMYYAVWRFGPRWSVSEIVPCVANPAIGKFCASSLPKAIQFAIERPVVNQDNISLAKQELDEVRDHIEKTDLTPEQLQALADSKSPIRLDRSVVRKGVSASDMVALSRFEDYHSIEPNDSSVQLPQIQRLFQP